ncbi:acetyltransferase [Streptomyces sp. NBC_01280]|uniref:GNAT family N-acetyltransferase n=1 Tax=Streptomyces sp. NBC_01280 TaxID=2903810 RepID=UPI002E337100|nr:GNAT family N-acetyltransferase [Streptomyces sp. NBC_01280]
MSSTDARTDAGATPAIAPADAVTDEVADTGPGADELTGSEPGVGTDVADTLDLRLPDELIDLIAGQGETGGQASGSVGQGTGAVLPGYGHPVDGTRPHAPCGTSTALADDDLLDNVGAWGPVTTRSGVFQLVPVRIERDLALISRWMNDPAVAAFWELEGPESVTENHLRPQLDGDGRSVPCLGVLDGTPMSYWEIYRADLDPLARHYPARPHDTGVHLLIGGVANRGRGLGTGLLKAVADLVLDHRPPCARVVAEPDLRNTPSVSAFLSAGFRFSAEVELPDKRAALMIRDRALRALL